MRPRYDTYKPGRDPWLVALLVAALATMALVGLTGCAGYRVGFKVGANVGVGERRYGGEVGFEIAAPLTKRTTGVRTVKEILEDSKP